jgi:enamine deaminase RidA (YjgF/YER057c/UK114 family)
MELNDALYSYLSGYSGLTALVSSRIYPDKLSDRCTLPAVTYQLISEEETEAFRQPSTSLLSAVYSITVWASTRAAANMVSKQLRKAFKNYSGTMGGTGGVPVSAVLKVARITDVDLTREGAVIAYKDVQDFEFWYAE